MFKKIPIIILLYTVNILTAQNQANIWYFGENAGINFNSGTPVALTNGALNTFEGCATISTPDGDLLFYTDGSTVYNSTHAIMQNGTGLLGHSSSTQSAIIVSKPGDSSIFFIFTTARAGEPDGLNYSEVDMSLDGGLGAITSNKNIQLFTPITEKLTAIQHANGQDIWVVTHEMSWGSTNNFMSYLVTDSGVNTAPILSGVGPILQPVSTLAAAGTIKISPDGTKLAICNASIGTQLYDFDTATGVVSNPIDLSNRIREYAAEFSSSSNVLYVCNSDLGKIYQYNLNAVDISASEIIIANAPSSAGIQLGPDQKIYVTVFGEDYLNVIESPNLLGVACGYTENTVSLNGKICYSGLPPFIQSYFNVAFQTENLCFGETTAFSASLPTTYDSILWYFGDGITSNLEAPTHVYANAGDYDVSLTVTVSGNASTDTRTVTIFEQPTATQPQNVLICDTNNDGLHTFDLTIQNTSILNGQSATTFEVLYYASMADYNNDTPIANPTNYTNITAYASQNIIASVRNINNTNCEAITDFNIQVFDTPTPSQIVPNLEFCDNTSVGTDTDGIIFFDLTQNEANILNGQSVSGFTVRYFTDAGLNNEITTPSNYQNTSTTETIYVQVENNTNAVCVAETSFTISVFALPTITAVVTLSQCDDDVDGFSSFNLNEVANEISTNAANETISFYETQTEAENSTNTIINTTAYTNQVVSSDTVWARIENTNGCYRAAQVNLLVSTTQIPLNFTRDFYECDDATDADAHNGITAFNFSTVTTEIEALFPTGQQLIINYYRNQADALAENNPITDISNYYNIGYPNTQNIYIRVDSAVNNDCLGLGQHITLHVEPLPLATGPIIIEQCDAGNDGTEAIDTSTINTELLQGQTNVAIAFTDASGNALPNPLPNPLVTGTQSITATMTNTNSQDPDGACSVWTTIDIVIDAGVTANAVPDFSVCDDNNDGQFDFDTATIEATILGGQTNVNISYQDENGNPLPSPLPNPFTTETQTITAIVENPTNAMCFAETEINFIVSSQPTANTVANQFICDDITNDGEHVFNLLGFNAEVLNGQSSTVYNVSYYNTQTDADNKTNALPNNYLSSTTAETIFARIENNDNDACYDTTSFEIGVSYIPIANQPDDISICDDETNDGFESFNLSDQNITILNGQSNTENTISYHLTQNDAETNTNALGNSFTNTESPQTIYVRVENVNNPSCYTTTTFQLIVNEEPILNMSSQWTICEDGSVDIIADGGYDSYLWSTGETSQHIAVFEAGTYSVTASNSYGNLICEVTKQITVVESNTATITEIETVDWTQNDNTITVTVEGNGDYEYSLNDITYQDSNVFTNLSIDDYTVYVRDKNGCGIVNQEVYLLYYPSYFTPNGDGVHETWNIYNSNKEPRNIIYIFDRYGKLITQLKPNSNGWDGTLKGNPLPASDYWFVVNRQNGKRYTGHFALKR